MKRMKKEKIEFIALILILLIGLGSAFTKFLVMPERTVIQDLNNQVTNQKKSYEDLLSYQKNKSGLEEEIKAQQAKVVQLNSEIPDRFDNPQLMVELYTLAKQHGVTPQSIAFEPVQNKGTYQEMGLSFSCLGQTGNILTLIQELQFGGSQRLAIKSINLTVAQGVMKAELKLMAYSSLGKSGSSDQKPSFMNSPIGVDSPTKMFQP